MKLIIFLSLLVFAQCAGAAELPYPVLFIHGLDSDDQTWDTFLDGTLRPALGNPTIPVFHVLANSDLSETRWQGEDETAFTDDDDILIANPGGGSDVPNSPLYKVNFHCWRTTDDPPYDIIPYISRDATPWNLISNSAGNESAITKEAIALKWIIVKILLATGRDKVIIVGHSAGGLVAREYLQRRDLETWVHQWWVLPQEDDGHRVAKLVTIGTPHLGSNFLNLPTLNSNKPGEGSENPPILMPNLESELVRDLRYSYGPFNQIRGVYLFGGEESSLWGNDYHNYDVNCNGTQSDDAIIGMSDWDNWSDNLSMSLPEDVEYLWIISNWSGDEDGGDGLVNLPRQWLHNRPDTLLTNRPHIDIPFGAEGETKDAISLIRGLDNTSSPVDPWEIEGGHSIVGWIDYQANMAAPGHNVDLDYYRVTLDNPMTPTMTVSSPTAVIDIVIRNDQGIMVFSAANVSGEQDFNLGYQNTNFLDVAVIGTAYQGSWQNPYTFRVETTDLISPDPVTDLSVTLSGSNLLTASWTASGDDNLSGVGFHTLAYSTSPITDDNFAYAEPVFENQQFPGGIYQSHEFSAPFANTTYWMAMKTRDDVGHSGPLSNVVTVTVPPIIPGSGPQITLTETYFDNDPGHGNGILMPAGPGYDVSFSTAIDVSNLSPGLHTVYHRYQMTDGSWSAEHARNFYVTPPVPAGGFQIANAEFFFDGDPGIGNGLTMTVNPASEVTVFATPGVQALAVGQHTISVRHRCNNGTWTLAVPRRFQVVPAPSLLTAAEYFFDGDSTQPVVVDFTDSLTVRLIVQPAMQAMNFGPHKVSLRFMTQNGVQSALAERTFQVIPAPSPLAWAEYFWDNDPGFGNGTALDFDDTNIITLIPALNVPNYSAGNHTFSLRYRTAAGVWSAATARSIFLQGADASGSQFIAGGETFLDSDPGTGQGLPLVAEDGEFNEANETMYRNLLAQPMALGQHHVFARVHDNLGAWSHVLRDSFTVTDPQEIRLVASSDSTADSLRLQWTAFPEALEYRVYYDTNLSGSFANYMSVSPPDTFLTEATDALRKFYRVVAVLPTPISPPLDGTSASFSSTRNNDLK